jgi:hypothetical protein
MRKRIAVIATAAAMVAVPAIATGPGALGAVLTDAEAPVDLRPFEERYLDVRNRYVKRFDLETAGRNLVRDGYRESDGDVRTATRAEVTRSTDRMEAALSPTTPSTTTDSTATVSYTAAPTSVIACESGGDYAAVDSTGTYYGAYQFDQQTWDAYAPDGYAGTSPAAAPPEVQDATAASVPYDAWPNC